MAMKPTNMYSHVLLLNILHPQLQQCLHHMYNICNSADAYVFMALIVPCYHLYDVAIGLDDLNV